MRADRNRPLGTMASLLRVDGRGTGVVKVERRDQRPGPSSCARDGDAPGMGRTRVELPAGVLTGA